MNNKIKDIFLIPSSQTDRTIIYSPLRKIAFWASTQEVEIIKDYLSNNVEMPQKYSKLYNLFQKLGKIQIIEPHDETDTFNHNNVIILLSQKCNLACSYCYAQDARSQETLSKDKIKIAVDYVLSNSPNEPKRFSFAGGGEPTFTWDLFVWAIKYIQKEAKHTNIRISLITNGTLLNEDRILWLKENQIGVNVSFDILPEIQNSQRPFPKNRKSFEVVDKNIKLLISNGISTPLRSTIASDSVIKMPEMVEFVHKNYPEIKILNLWPVIDIKQTQMDFYDKYVEYFFKARVIGDRYGIKVENWLTVLNKFHSRFCQEDFCITPSGEIVACLRASSKRDKNFNDFYFGDITDKFQIEKDKLSTAMQILNTKQKECITCFAKWSCAGICPNTRLLLSTKKHLLQYCNFVRKSIQKNIELELDKNDGIMDKN